MKRLPFWRLPPPAITILTTETLAPDMLCVLFAVSRLLAMLHLRYGKLGSHLTVPDFCLCLYLYLLVTTFVFSFCPHFGVGRLHVLHPVNMEAVPLVHTFCIFCVFYFSLHTLLYLSRKSRQKRSSYSATREAACFAPILDCKQNYSKTS